MDNFPDGLSTEELNFFGPQSHDRSLKELDSKFLQELSNFENTLRIDSLIYLD